MADEQAQPTGPDLKLGISTSELPDGTKLVGHVGQEAVLLVRRDAEVFAIGDSLAVLCDGDCIKATFPISVASAFTLSPRLLCTNPVQNAFLDEVDLAYDLVADWTFRGLKQPALLCMTDALGHWLLSQRDRNASPISALRKLRTPRAFARFVHEERAAGRMKRDDTTLIALW